MDSMDIKVHKSRLIKYVYYLDASDLPGSFQPAVDIWYLNVSNFIRNSIHFFRVLQKSSDRKCLRDEISWV